MRAAWEPFEAMSGRLGAAAYDMTGGNMFGGAIDKSTLRFVNGIDRSSEHGKTQTVVKNHIFSTGC